MSHDRCSLAMHVFSRLRIPRTTSPRPSRRPGRNNRRHNDRLFMSLFRKFRQYTGTHGLGSCSRNVPKPQPLHRHRALQRVQLDLEFYIGFLTPFIIDEINFAYGFIFAGCNLVVFFFLLESNGKTRRWKRLIRCMSRA